MIGSEATERGKTEGLDAVVVGSGPNGLAAAITMARAGRSVLVLEANHGPGGGARSAELTLPGFTHDVCSAIVPLGLASPFFEQLPLAEYGCDFVHPEIQLAHPLDGGRVATLHRSVEATAASLAPDSEAYRRLMGPLVRTASKWLPSFLGPVRPPRHPLAAAGFGLRAIRSVTGLARSAFEGELARGLLAGLGGHSFLPLDETPSAGFAIVLGVLGHTVGWPAVRGGTQRLTDALVSYLRSLGGEVVTNRRIASLGELPPSRVVLFDLTPRQLVEIAGHKMSPGYRRRLVRYRYGPGVFKIDWALDGPVPWTAPECTRAGTLHLGGTVKEIAAAERDVASGRNPQRPYVLFAQPSIFDPTRAPSGKHTGWAYCHVPSGSTFDMTERIEDQVERFASGFKDLILGRSVMSATDMHRYNANYVGGDINGGLQDWGQLFTRPVAKANPYSTPADGIYLCSSSTPPGGGVHGMCGNFAARAALRRWFN